MGWPLITNNSANLVPVESILAKIQRSWIDHLMIKTSSHKESPYAFSVMIQAQTQKKITDVTQYTPPTLWQIDVAEETKILHLDVGRLHARIALWQDAASLKYRNLNEVEKAPGEVCLANRLAPGSLHWRRTGVQRR